MQAYVVANLIRQQGMLVSRIVADQKDGGRVIHVTHAGGRLRPALQCGSKSREVSRAVMINIVGSQHHPRKLLQQVIFLVGCLAGTDNADCLSTFGIANLGKTPADQFECFFPGGRG